MKSFFITCSLFLIILVAVSCNQEGNNAIKENQMTNHVHSETIAFDVINLDENCSFIQYATASNTSVLALRKFAFVGETFQKKIEYFLYSGTSLEQLDYSFLSIDQFLNPFYINPSDEVYYLNGYKSVDESDNDVYWENYQDLILVTDKTSFLDFSKYGTMITSMNEPEIWILFDHSEISLHKYILYNLDTKEEFTFSFEHPIQKFLNFNNILVFGWNPPETDPRNLQYSVYEFIGMNEDTPFIEKASNISFPPGAAFIDYSSFSSELVWVNSDNNQIYVTDITTDSPPKTLLSDTDISKVYPFRNNTTQGFWVIPTITSTGDDNTIYMFIWEHNEIQKQEYHIHPCFFEKNTFCSEQGNLYLISTDYSQATPIYQLHILNPANSSSYQTHIIEITSPLLQQNANSMHFKKLFMDSHQVLLEVTANTHNYHPDNQLAGLYRIMLRE